jgi:hypothetical protein
VSVDSGAGRGFGLRVVDEHAAAVETALAQAFPSGGGDEPRVEAVGVFDAVEVFGEAQPGSLADLGGFGTVQSEPAASSPSRAACS